MIRPKNVPRPIAAWTLLVCLPLLVSLGCAKPKRQLLMEELDALGYETKETERGIVVFFPDVLFAFDRAELTDDGERKVEGVAELLERLGSFEQLAIEGNTDSLGTAEYNQWLSEQRAEAVAAALRATGIDSGRLETIGHGETQPLQPNRLPDGRDDPAARRLNRRVEMILLVP